MLLRNTLLAEPEFNALVVVWSKERSTRGTTRITGCDTAQTERILDKTCDHSTPLDSRLYQAMRMKTTWRTIHVLTPFHLVCCCRLVPDVQSPLLLSPPHFVQVQRNVRNTNFCWSNRQLPGWEKPHAKTVAWCYDMEGHAQKCVERYCELASKKTEQLYKVPSPCLDEHRFKKEDLESVGELSKVCSQDALKMLVFGQNW